MQFPITSHKQKKYMKRIGCSYFRMGCEKTKKKSVILDWRQRYSGRLNEEERSTGLLSERRDLLVAQAKGEFPLVSQATEREPLVTQADLAAPRACSPAAALLNKKGPCHRRKICANSLWLYSPSKNKNINYIFIYLRVLRCLSNGPIYDTNVV